MRLKADVQLESEPYADMVPPVDVSNGIPLPGDELLVADVAYTCTRRRFDYDAGGRLKNVTLFVKR